MPAEQTNALELYAGPGLGCSTLVGMNLLLGFAAGYAAHRLKDRHVKTQQIAPESSSANSVRKQHDPKAARSSSKGSASTTSVPAPSDAAELRRLRQQERQVQQFSSLLQVLLLLQFCTKTRLHVYALRSACTGALRLHAASQKLLRVIFGSAALVFK